MLHKDDLLAIKFVLVVFIAAFVFDNLVIDAGKEVRPAVVVVLSPVIERMVVAFGRTKSFRNR